MKKIIFGLFALILFISFFLLFSLSTMPDSPLFLVKRLEEKVILGIQPGVKSSILYRLSLLDSRLKELRYITENKKYDLFYSSALRYSTLVGEIASVSISNDKVLSGKILSKFKSHERHVKTLLSKKGKKEEWKFIEDPLNSLIIFEKRLMKK